MFVSDYLDLPLRSIPEVIHDLEVRLSHPVSAPERVRIERALGQLREELARRELSP
jgi:hypothetical protein